MRISVLGLRGIPGVMGGVESHCEELYPRLREHLAEDRICVLARSPYVEKVQEFHGIRVRPVFALRNKYLEAMLHTAWGLFVARFSERADVVHLHAVGPGLMAPLARLLGMRVVFTHHGEDYRRAKWNGFAKLALRLGEKAAIRFSDRIISVSRPVADRLRARYPHRAEEITVIPNGAPAELARVDSSAAGPLLERLGLRPGEFVLTVGRLVPEKAIHDLVSAFEGLPGDMKLVVVGGAQMDSEYAAALRARASGRVIFAGQLPREEVYPLYAASALFVLASTHEGLPIVALEALAAGARVLLSDIDANLDVGLPPENYFPVTDVAALRARLADIGAIPLADRAGIAARYDWGNIARETARVFRRVHSPEEPLLARSLSTADRER